MQRRRSQSFCFFLSKTSRNYEWQTMEVPHGYRIPNGLFSFRPIKITCFNGEDRTRIIVLKKPLHLRNVTMRVRREDLGIKHFYDFHILIVRMQTGKVRLFECFTILYEIKLT